MLRPLTLAAALAFFTGCAGEAGVPGVTPEPSRPADAETPPSQEGADPAPADGPGVDLDRILAPRDDDTELLASLREPRQRRAEPVPNRHVQGQVDTVRTYAYDGLVLEVYDVTGGPAYVQRLAVTSSDYRTVDGLSVDATRAGIERILGEPTAEVGDHVTYEAGDGPAPTTVEVTYEPGAGGTERAAEIVWRPYVD